MTDRRVRSLSDHYCDYFAGRAHEDFRFDAGAIRESIPQFQVRCVAPSRADNTWVYASLGASLVQPQAPSEYVLTAPDQDACHVELLAMVANMHADPTWGPVELGRVLDIGRPWVEGASADRLLVSLPYPYGPKLEWCVDQRDAARVRVLWLLPITESEAAYLVSHGQEALERLFDDAELEYADPARRPVV